MLVDYHTHHYRCGHAKGTLIDYARQAARLGFREIGFSDHAPIFHLSPSPQAYPTTAMSQLELPNYIAEALSVKETMCDQIAVRIGIESDYLPEWESHYRALWDRQPLDYRIGSVHWLGKWSIFSSRLPEGRTSASILQEYLETTVALAKSGVFDIIAHVDCLKTMGLFSSSQLTHVMEDTVGVLAETGIVVEFNTSGWRKPINEAYPSPRLLQLCRASGVAVTLSSDAHNPSEVGFLFERAASALRKAGYNSIATFHGRRKGVLPLEEALLVLTSSGVRTLPPNLKLGGHIEL